MKYLFALCSLLIFLWQNNLLSENIRIGSALLNNPNETAIAINPSNPLHVVAGSNLHYFYYSYDGGKTWQENTMTSNFGVWGDPCVIFDNYGDLYFSHLSNPPLGSWIDRIVVQKSSDMGQTWEIQNGIGLVSGKMQDKEWMVVDNSTSKYRDNLYMSWTQFDKYASKDSANRSSIRFSASRDRGVSWSDAIVVSDTTGNCLDDSYTAEGAMPAVGPNGEVYVVWSLNEKLYFDKSTDGGISFGQDKLIAYTPGGWNFSIPGLNRCNGLPVTISDLSSTDNRGNIYVIFGDKRNGDDDADIFLIRSTDGGSSWSDAIRINNDETRHHQFLPWAAVDQSTGYLYVVFYDRRSYYDRRTDVYLAKSIDGGLSWENRLISDEPFVPQPNVFIGDYNGIAANDGIILPIWTRMDGGQTSLRTVIIDENTSAVNNSDISLSVNCYPNPFTKYVAFNVLFNQTGRCKLEIISTTGNVIDVVCDRFISDEKLNLIWDAEDFPQGLYFYRLTSNDRIISGKIVKINQ